jgi:hypothetical protein
VKKLFFFVVLSFIAAAPVLRAQAAQDFTLINKTGLSIDQLFISATDKAEWEEDVLGVEVLPADAEAEINFHPTEGACFWDLKIVDEEGDSVEWDDIDLCEAVTVTLYWKDGQATAEIDKGEGSEEGSDEGGEE